MEFGFKNDTKQDFYKQNTNAPLLAKLTPHSVSVPTGTVVNVGGKIIRLASDYVLDLDVNLDTGAKTAGTDYYIYALTTGGFVLSANNSYPSGYTAENSRKIGGFHYGLTLEDEAPTGNKTEADMVKIRGINAYSLWDLKWHPAANPEGMVYIAGRWYDIYLLNSDHIVNGTSKASATIAGGATTYGRAIPKVPLQYGGNGDTVYAGFKWFHANEIAAAHAKELISYAEFMAIAYGVQEGASSSAVDGGLARVEHYGFLTSKYGIEQAAGTQYIWGKDVAGNRDEGSTTWAWQNVAENRGQIYATHANHITAVSLGGARGAGGHAGSRASDWDSYVWYSDWSVGSRFACDHVKLA
ncbi:MAG TPA: hypothetical protein CFH81_02120 [Sulfurovum sp. UBA12169]|nr:MAG TPA: hypothetical protein CFH81_02120 [Sulfurovum sp. UBA12169]